MKLLITGLFVLHTFFSSAYAETELNKITYGANQINFAFPASGLECYLQLASFREMEQRFINWRAVHARTADIDITPNRIKYIKRKKDFLKLVFVSPTNKDKFVLKSIKVDYNFKRRKFKSCEDFKNNYVVTVSKDVIDYKVYPPRPYQAGFEIMALSGSGEITVWLDDEVIHRDSGVVEISGPVRSRNMKTPHYIRKNPDNNKVEYFALSERKFVKN